MSLSADWHCDWHQRHGVAAVPLKHSAHSSKSTHGEPGGGVGDGYRDSERPAHANCWVTVGDRTEVGRGTVAVMALPSASVPTTTVSTAVLSKLVAVLSK